MNKDKFLLPIIRLRVLQLYYHHCHNLTKGLLFFQDHEFLGSAYAEVEGHYDSLAEYCIASLGDKAFDTELINKGIAKGLTGLKINSMAPNAMLEKALVLEAELYEDLTELDKGSPIGLRNLIGAIAEASDVRKYKLQQRLG